VEWDKFEFDAMKLSPTLLKSIALGISVGTLIVSCEGTEVNSSANQTRKPKKQINQPLTEKENSPNPYVNGSCPNCGKG